jgi:phosphohistidine phosphatase
MKTLLVLRHAKSSWKHEGLADHDRPLNKRGQRDAPRVGEVIASYGLVPELVFSSSARRAWKTAEAAAQAMEFEGDIAVDRRLYLASPLELIEFVREIAEPSASAMIVGHNPGLEEFAATLIGSITPMPTSALLVLGFDVPTWANASLEGGAKLVRTWRPKEERQP